MPMFRKKPVVIEARQVPDLRQPQEDWDDIADWCGGDDDDSDNGWSIFLESATCMMRADPGDWIIKGVNGEFYPCKPDIFAATYEPAEG